MVVNARLRLPPLPAGKNAFSYRLQTHSNLVRVNTSGTSPRVRRSTGAGDSNNHITVSRAAVCRCRCVASQTGSPRSRCVTARQRTPPPDRGVSTRSGGARDGHAARREEAVQMRIGLIAPPWVPVPPPAYGGTEVVIDNLARGLQD